MTLIIMQTNFCMNKEFGIMNKRGRAHAIDIIECSTLYNIVCLLFNTRYLMPLRCAMCYFSVFSLHLPCHKWFLCWHGKSAHQHTILYALRFLQSLWMHASTLVITIISHFEYSATRARERRRVATACVFVPLQCFLFLAFHSIHRR